MPIVLATSAQSDYAFSTTGVTGVTTSAQLAPGIVEGIKLNGQDMYALGRFDSPLTNFWATYYLYISGLSNYAHSLVSFGYAVVFPYSIVNLFSIRAGETEVSIYRSSNSELLATSGIPLTLGTPERIDVRCRPGPSSTQIQVYINGVLAMDWTGTLVVPQPFSTIKLQGDALLGFATLSHVITASQDTRSFIMNSLPISGQGFFTEWEGDYTMVDEVGFNPTDFIVGETPGLRETFTFSKPEIPVGYNVGAIVVNAQASIYGETVDELHAIQYDGSESASMGTFENLNVGFLGNRVICEINPQTGIRYTPVEYDNLEFGFETA